MSLQEPQEPQEQSKETIDQSPVQTNKIDNSRDNSRIIATNATRTFITKYLNPLIGRSDTVEDKFFKDERNLVILKKKLKKKMAAVMFEQMMKNKKMFEEDGK